MTSLSFDAHFLQNLPVDEETRNFRRQVQHAVASYVTPTPVKDPSIIAWSKETAALVDLPTTPNDSPIDLAAILGGNLVPEGMTPWAACYGGHQFGNWAGQLGDGRAISLGERVGTDGIRRELQLKGAGPTPYSRQGDGRAVLRSSVREFLCSEAMHHLGIPTTRALSLVLSGDQVLRDMFYDGNVDDEPGAIVCRVAPSFLRFGNFELFAARGDQDTLKQLVDYTIETHFAHLLQTPPEDRITTWFKEICERTALMITHWMRVGFVHGVMNTDNMSILGLTIDYGPYGWLDDYNPGWTPNTTDASGKRYRYSHQPRIGAWNLGRLAEALYPLVGSLEPLQEGMEHYMTSFEAMYFEQFASKLGLLSLLDDLEEEDPNGRGWLLGEVQSVLMETPTDMTLFFRQLALVPLDGSLDDDLLLAPLEGIYYDEEQAKSLRARTATMLRALIRLVQTEGQDPQARITTMNLTNPKYVLRNYLAQVAIEHAEEGEMEQLLRLFKCIKSPYDEQPEYDDLAKKRPEWARHKPGCSMLSCSS